MAKTNTFSWAPNERPPQISHHSKAKLAALRLYLHNYFDKLNIQLIRDKFKLDLIDGFAGGGIYQDGNEVISGSPLIMLEEAKEAEHRLLQRQTKRLDIDIKYYFVDAKRQHTEHLRRVLEERDYQIGGDKIAIYTSEFGDVVDKIIGSVKRRQPRSGRSIFLLDQCGYSQVHLSMVRKIFYELKNAEVIMTFAADALINFLHDSPQMASRVAPLGISKERFDALLESKHDGGRALVQRQLKDHLIEGTKAPFFTPFFIRPAASHRALWFVHLSRHPTARDVMVGVHWSLSNTFEHYGPGGFGMLGWEALRCDNIQVFNFHENDASALRDEFIQKFPERLKNIAKGGGVSVEDIHKECANQTAARFSDMDSALLELFRAQEINILNADGRKPRSRTVLRHLTPKDIIVPSQLITIPSMRRRQS